MSSRNGLVAGIVLVLALAGCVGRRAALPRLPESPPSAGPVTPEPRPEEAEYTVQPGDTLERIAMATMGRAELWRHLMEWNKLHEFGRAEELPAGAKVYIPDRIRILAKDQFKEVLAAVPRRAPATVATARKYSFKARELLEYKVKYLGITAGYASMYVRPPTLEDGVPVMHFEANAWSKILFFFKVQDRVESIARMEDLMPLKFEKHLSEGNYKKDMITRFDLDNMSVHWEGKSAQLADNCRDIMAGFYYFRSMKLPEPGGSTEVCVHTDGTNYPLVVEVLSRERIKVPAGEFDAILIKPRMKFEGLFRQKGDLLIWLTDDPPHVPLLVKAKVFLLGSVHIMLIGKGIR